MFRSASEITSRFCHPHEGGDPVAKVDSRFRMKDEHLSGPSNREPVSDNFLSGANWQFGSGFCLAASCSDFTGCGEDGTAERRRMVESLQNPTRIRGKFLKNCATLEETTRFQVSAESKPP